MSPPRSRSGGMWIVNDVEAIVEVLAERPSSTIFLQVPVGGRHDAHVDLDVLVAAHALELALLEEPEQLDLDAWAETSPISSRKRVPPSASSKARRRA